MDDQQPQNTIRQLTPIQRRIIGSLMEKAFTTPDQYPLTLKALTAACNQKSNRNPVTQYEETDILSALEDLREQQLIAEVFTDGGRAARYRHYMRYRFDFSEAQFAIVAELLLRGSQQPGELRSRVSRMKRIDTQEQLRSELQALQDKGFVQASGPLDRRGVVVDHTWYTDREQPSPAASKPGEPPAPAADAGTAVTPLEDEVRRLRQEVDELKQAVQRLETRIS